MTDSLLIWIMVIAFFSVFTVHQISRFIIGKDVDYYFASIVITGAMAWFLWKDLSLTVLVLISGLAGHLISVYISRRFRSRHCKQNNQQ